MFSIIYNFCRNTITTPRDYEGGDKCVETQHKVVDGKAELTKEPAPAFLLSKPVGEESTCIRLGLDYTVDSNSEMGLYDITDPAMGVVIKYKEGDFCCPYKTCNNEDSQTDNDFHFSPLCRCSSRYPYLHVCRNHE